MATTCEACKCDLRLPSFDLIPTPCMHREGLFEQRHPYFPFRRDVSEAQARAIPRLRHKAVINHVVSPALGGQVEEPDLILAVCSQLLLYEEPGHQSIKLGQSGNATKQPAISKLLLLHVRWIDVSCTNKSA